MAKRVTAARSEAEQILEKAKERGVESNFFFTTTFERYQGQIKIAKALEREVEQCMESGNLEGKIIRLYESAVAGANGTAATLVSIIKKLGTEEQTGSKLQEFISGIRDDDE